jgi:HTH-type transcriptional regulator / antitoxin HipB
MPPPLHSAPDLGPPPRGRVEVLGAHVRSRREGLGLRQAELADLAGCSTRFVHEVEAGKETARLDKVLDVLEVLGLDLALVPGAGRIRPPEEGPARAGGEPSQPPGSAPSRPGG